jgi:hypothetical protein
MNISFMYRYFLLFLTAFCVSCRNQPQVAPSANDSNTPLHLLQPAYGIQYGIPSEASVVEVLDRILNYLDGETPTSVIDRATGMEITDYTKIDRNSLLKRGAFRLASYEWGVVYAGMTLAGEVTGENRFSDYTARRLRFLSEITPYFRELIKEGTVREPQLRQVVSPEALDDCGSMCAAFIKASYQKDAPDYKAIIDNYTDWIMNGQMRLADGTLARNRPHLNTLWLDDMFMSVPALAWMGKYTGDTKYYDEAVRQIRQFSARMFVAEKNLFMHGWENTPATHNITTKRCVKYYSFRRVCSLPKRTFLCMVGYMIWTNILLFSGRALTDGLL